VGVLRKDALGRDLPAPILVIAGEPMNTIRRHLTWLAAAVLAIGLLPALVPSLAVHANAATCGSPGCAVTVNGVELDGSTPVGHYNFVVNLDNTKLPNDPNALSTESNSPVVAEGSDAHPTVNLPDGRYLISMRAVDHKMWGAYINLPNDAPGGAVTEKIALSKQSADNPLPLGKIRVFVFNDNSWTNGAPDTEEAGLQGFQVGLEEQTNSAVTVDYNNQPLCGGVCKTGADGFVQIDNLGPATYFIDVHPPTGPCNSNPDSHWYQTTTIDGGLQLLAPVEEGSDGTGSPGEQLWEPPNNRTAYWFGFVCAPQDFATPGTGEVTGTAKNWVEWAPYTTGTFDVPVEQPFVALSDSATDRTVYVGRGDADGNFDIQNVPPGSYNLAIWDEQLSYIMRFKSIEVTAGQTLDVNEVGDDGSVGVGVSRWFGWLSGTVYKDNNNNGQYDAGVDSPIPNTDMDQRWRDGSIKENTTTNANGHYEYPTAEGGALGRWFINEQGFARFSAFPGPSVVDERTGAVTPSCAVDTSKGGVPANPCLPTDEGGGLLANQSLLEGHHATVDWGKRNYDPGTPGQIVGITYFATTRNEFDARKQAHEDYEPAIPDVTVYLEDPGPDGKAGGGDDHIVNSYVTDHWKQPKGCGPILDYAGNDVSNQFNADIGPNCLEVPLDGEHTKDGAFDGGYAFSSYCPATAGYFDTTTGNCGDGSSPDDHPLTAGTYITQAIMPKDSNDTRPCNNLGPNDPNVSEPNGTIPGGGTGCLYRPVKEEDVNVDLGNNFTPAIPEPPCVGDDHVIDQSTLTPRSNHYGVSGASAPLCDKKKVVLTNGQNANADFHLMTNFPTDANGQNQGDTHVGDVPIPGRLVGQVFNDIYFETNPQSPWYGEPRPIAGIPVGIYARVDTAPNVNQPYDPNNWRLLTTTKTSPDGSFEALVPSTETFNCPIPQGPCPGMYLVVVDDPGSKANPNANFNPNLLYATTPADAWPGLTTQLDLPLDPISGTACEDPAAPARPELLQVSRPYVNPADSGTGRRITIQGDFIGTSTATGNAGGRITLTDQNTGQSTVLTRSAAPPGAGGGIVSWTPGSGSTPDTIVFQVPATSTSFLPGPKQLKITTAAANGSVSSVNGITIHVRGTTGATSYLPPVVNVPAPPVSANTHVLQNAIDSAAPGSLLVLGAGTYNENVLLWKPLKLQGLGPGGIIGSHELQARDPEDPRFHIAGSVIDGRYFQQNASYYDSSVVPGHAPYAGVNAAHPVLRGADVTVVAQSQTAYGSGSNAARIDGIGMTTGSGEGAGGIQAQAYANDLQISNDVLENNSGVVAGGVGLGQPFDTTSHNYNVRMVNDRFIGNGGLTQAGGVGIFGDSNNYELARSVVCSNFSVNYGAGVSHIGLSPNGSIHDNQIYYNDSVDSGAGLAIESELPAGGGSLGTGTGAVNVDRNLIQSNYSGDDGGGVFVLDALRATINLRNNQIVDNGSADIGGAVMLDDASDVRMINNTVANNVSTGSSENSDGKAHSAGLASEANDPLFQTTLPAGSPDFSKPSALFNNIFWDNQAFTLDRPGPGATLVSQGFVDFEIHGTGNPSDRFTPRYSDLTNGQMLDSTGTLVNVPAAQGNLTGVDPGFVTPFTLELTVSGSRLDPQTAAVTITGADPPVGLAGDYHIAATSGVVDRGVRCSNTAAPAPVTALAPCTAGGISAPTLSPALGGLGDYDGQYRPMQRSLRLRTPWDLGADELIGVPVTLMSPLSAGANVARPR
jgi:large repetitive protein